LTLKKTFKQKTSAKIINCDIANNNNTLQNKNSVAIVENTKPEIIEISISENEVDKNIKSEKSMDVCPESKPESKLANIEMSLEELDINNKEKNATDMANGVTEENDNCSASSKRSRSTSECSERIKKRTKKDEQTIINITSTDSKITETIIRDYQNALSEKMENYTELPLIECHGVQNGGLTYSCYNDLGVVLVDSVASELNLISTKLSEFKKNGRHIMSIKLNSYVGVNLKKLFSKVECYNIGLSTDLWSVLEVNIQGGYIVIVLEIDELSLEYISEANYRLFAGVDRLRFSFSWI
jgi:hypothetical protein